MASLIVLQLAAGVPGNPFKKQLRGAAIWLIQPEDRIAALELFGGPFYTYEGREIVFVESCKQENQQSIHFLVKPTQRALAQLNARVAESR